jgi:hypothetical protein
MTLRYELPAKMVCPTAGFHRYRACLQLRSKPPHAASPQLTISL